jgi:hypothetical protein
MAADSSHPIPFELRQFIRANVNSIEQLEVLILLSDNPSRVWSASEVFRHVQSSEKSVLDCLEGFRVTGLASRTPDGLFCFSSHDAELAKTASVLARVYRERRISVIVCIYENQRDSIKPL